MKKKLFFSLLCLVLLFSLSGCYSKSDEFASDGTAKNEFVDLRYKQPKDFVKKEPFEMQGMKTLVYRLDNTDENVNISMYYNTGKDYNYITDEYTEYTEKEINGVKWRVMHDDDFGIVTDVYYIVHNNDLYQIELNGIDKKPDMSSFMNEVSFK